MKRIDRWFEEYGESHEDHTNKLIHWICVPAIMFSVLGLLRCLPAPSGFASIPLAHWAALAVVLTLIYYLSLSPSLALGMLLVSGAMLGGIHMIRLANLPLLWVSLGIFAAAWVGQFIGHKVEGKKPSFFKDLQFLLIGPVWLLSFVYRRLRIPY